LQRFVIRAADLPHAREEKGMVEEVDVQRMSILNPKFVESLNPNF